jgi:electron transfer flavoprotein beta subunit
MKIAVCVKHVPVQLRMQAEMPRLDRSGPGELNDADRNAIEEALRLKADADAEVVIVSMGPEAATESLRTALAMGADRAVLLSDAAAAAGSDFLATSRLLAAVLEREHADLVFFGQQASDGGGAVLWAAVAEHLRLPFVSQTAELTVADASVRVARETEFGDDMIEVELPAVVAVSDTINEPRYTSLKGMMGAKKKPLEVLSVADLGLDPSAAGAAGSRTEVLAVAPPPARVDAVRVEDGDDNAAQAVFDFLVEKQLA